MATATPIVSNATLIADAAWTDMRRTWPGRSVDDLLCNPKDALSLCRRVRAQFASATDPEICRSLLNARKRGHLI